MVGKGALCDSSYSLHLQEPDLDIAEPATKKQKLEHEKGAKVLLLLYFAVYMME